MIKPLVVVQGPVATRSGYGNHTRDIVTSLIDMDKYEIKIISLPWGHCPMDALNQSNPKHKAIIDCFLTQQLNRQPDIFIQISVPNEFCLDPKGNEIKPGKFNIGITAGVETDVMAAELILGCNRMDLVIATSEHSKNVMIRSTYDKMNDQTKQKDGELKLTTPVEVLFEGVDLDVYMKTAELDKPVVETLNEIPEQFCYLVCGHWISGNIGEDRKDIGMTIKTFAETFKNTNKGKRPALILKSSGATFSIIDRDQIQAKIEDILSPYGDKAPNVYLLHGDLSDNEMNSLYNHPKVKAMVSFTKGEGYGRPLAEYAMSGKPILASNWSGQIDFLNKEYCTLLPGQLTKVHKSAANQFLVEGSQWFTVEYSYASKVMKDVFKHYKKYLEKSRKMPQHMKDNFSMEKMTERFSNLLNKIDIPVVPQKMDLKLPKLKKDSSTKINLPKLKKVTL